MKRWMLIIFIACAGPQAFSQSLYFPPLTGKTWDTLSVEQAGWCADKVDSLYDFLEQKGTRAFLVLKDGKIVIEKYFGAFTQDSNWYWASAGKTLTGMLLGIAQEQSLLRLTDASSKYLGTGWSSEPPAKEQLITVRHHITMSTGLDDAVPNSDCTADTCLVYKADAGMRWAYHNAPYTLLDKVIAAASGQTFTQFFTTNIRNKIGMNGLWIKTGDNNVYYSTPRSMARYGLLLLNRGSWNGTPVLSDTTYFNQMTHTSQDMNLSYGYLTWLNGKGSYMAPGTQIVFPGALCPEGPPDMFAAIGKYGQIMNVVPGQHIVVIRMGDSPGDLGAVSIPFNNDLWRYLNKVICKKPSALETLRVKNTITVSPNPVDAMLYIEGSAEDELLNVSIIDLAGRDCGSYTGIKEIEMNRLPAGTYIVKVVSGDYACRFRVFKK